MTMKKTVQFGQKCCFQRSRRTATNIERGNSVSAEELAELEELAGAGEEGNAAPVGSWRTGTWPRRSADGGIPRLPDPLVCPQGDGAEEFRNLWRRAQRKHRGALFGGARDLCESADQAMDD